VGKERGGDRIEIRLAGSGGQGVVLAGVILAEAAILSGKNAAQSQAYGPQSRGGASRADVVIAEDAIGFPQAQALDVLLALTQEACERYTVDLRAAGLLVVDEGTVAAPEGAGWSVHALPIAETAVREAGSAMATNMVALGALAELTGVVTAEVLEQAVVARVPARHRELNVRALAAGRRLAQG